ncbi:hypothetical protein D3C73_1368900 [compost metagenome]
MHRVKGGAGFAFLSDIRIGRCGGPGFQVDCSVEYAAWGDCALLGRASGIFVL